MNKRFNLLPTPRPPHKDPPAWQVGLCVGDSRPLPAGKRPWVHPAGWGLRSPKPKACRDGDARKRREGAESRSGNAGPRAAPLGRGAAGARGRAGGGRVRGRGGGAAGARGAPGFPLCQPPCRWRPRLLGVSGPKCGGCQRLTSPLPAGSGSRGRGHPQKGPERPPAPGLCPSSCTFSPPCPLEFSSFICSPRSSPFQRPICRHPPPSFSVSTHPSSCLRSFSFSCTRLTFSEVPGGAVERYPWVSGAPSCPTWPSLASGLGEGGTLAPPP